MPPKKAEPDKMAEKMENEKDSKKKWKSKHWGQKDAPNNTSVYCAVLDRSVPHCTVLYRVFPSVPDCKKMGSKQSDAAMQVKRFAASEGLVM